MRFDGEWLECDDGIVRPTIRAEMSARGNVWRAVEFLVDTGADRTVISANVLESLDLDTTEPQDRIGGIGGLVDSVIVRTQINPKPEAMAEAGWNVHMLFSPSPSASG